MYDIRQNQGCDMKSRMAKDKRCNCEACKHSRYAQKSYGFVWVCADNFNCNTARYEPESKILCEMFLELTGADLKKKAEEADMLKQALKN